MELKALNHDEQIDRLCELNVMRQTFHVCTSPIVQSAWDQGQELAVFGVIYGLQDGL
jgi:carbonic anhydrase